MIFEIKLFAYLDIVDKNPFWKMVGGNSSQFHRGRGHFSFQMRCKELNIRKTYCIFAPGQITKSALAVSQKN